MTALTDRLHSSLFLPGHKKVASNFDLMIDNQFMNRSVVLLGSPVFLLLTCAILSAQTQTRSTLDEQLYALARTDLKAFAQQVSRDSTSELGRAQAIVRWLAEHFEWKATDYQKRTVQEIVERRGGNCNELAMVALAAMKELNIKLRRVHEVNIYTNTPERGERAHQMVKDKGN